ncbi:MAG TPA: type VI immunity family protein [Longimicrobiaceae bacterium]|nr:type VI immunity family protein [Longimicrobiaceae bacterium]
MEEISLFQDLDRLAVTAERGERTAVVGRIVFGMSFFLRDPHTPAARARVVAAAEHLLSVVPYHHYLWWLLHGRGRPQSLRRGEPPAPGEILRRSEEADLPFGLKLWDSEPHDATAPRHYLEFFCMGGSEEDRYIAPMGSLQLYVPLPWVESRVPGTVRDLFVRLADTLQPFHGTGGLALSSPVTREWQQSAGPNLYAVLHRFPGLETGYAWEMAGALEERMGSVNWLTAVHHDLLALVGGAGALRGALDPDTFPVHDYGGGLVIQAGPAPQLGDREAGVGIPFYDTVAGLLKPARVEFEGYVVNHAVRPPGSEFDDDVMARGQTEYLARFDP